MGEECSTGLYPESPPGDGPHSPGTSTEDGPSLKFIQSESLRKACLYISQKAVMESIGSAKSEDTGREKQGDVQTFGEKGECCRGRVTVEPSLGGQSLHWAATPSIGWLLPRSAATSLLQPKFPINLRMITFVTILGGYLFFTIKFGGRPKKVPL